MKRVGLVANMDKSGQLESGKFYARVGKFLYDSRKFVTRKFEIGIDFLACPNILERPDTAITTIVIVNKCLLNNFPRRTSIDQGFASYRTTPGVLTVLF